MSNNYISNLATLFLTVAVPSFVAVVVFVVILASLGKTVGIRQGYVNLLLKIFEFGKERLAKRKSLLYGIPENVENEEEEEVNNGRNHIQDIIFRPTLKKDSILVNDTHEFELSDFFDYIANGMEAIVDDEVTKRFAAEELPSWNLLTRTNCDYEFISVRLTILWVVGFLVRYFLLLPLRICILIIGVGFVMMFTWIMPRIPEGKVKQWIGYHAYLTTFRIIARAISSVIHFHNVENRPCSSGFCVANHTSPIDLAILSCDNVYAFVGQRHGGFLGILERALSRASDHIWFERGESKDRFAVAKRLREHVQDPTKMPILIFPEGTCINNTSVMQFKKGTFEVGGIIYPVAIKYDARFGDAFWNSSKYSMMHYIYMMMTSWAIVCDVWYLPPMTKKDNESSIDFANRVKAEIARQGGLVDLLWDGSLKRSAPKKELKEQYQHEFSRRLRLHKTDKVLLANHNTDKVLLANQKDDKVLLANQKDDKVLLEHQKDD